MNPSLQDQNPSIVAPPVSEFSRNRIVGLDIARSLALFGMVLVNCKYLLDCDEEYPSWLYGVHSIFEGRASVLFVVLAGVSLSLMSQKSLSLPRTGRFREIRRTLLKRSLFLLVCGCILIPIWPADILHFYALYFIIGMLALTRPSWQIWLEACCFVVGLFLFQWLAPAMVYDPLRENLSGPSWVKVLLEDLFFTGMHPVFPWAAIFLSGMWLGRQEIAEKKARRKLLLVAVACCAFSGIWNWSLQHLHLGLFPLHPLVTSLENGAYMLLNLVSTVSLAFVTILVSTSLGEKQAFAKKTRIFSQIGRLSLTLYVAHILVGSLFNQVLDFFQTTPSLYLPTFFALAFFAASMGYVFLWEKRYDNGPLEWAMRTISR